MASLNTSGVVENGNVIVYLYERPDDPFCGVHACPISHILPTIDKAIVSEKTVRTVKLNGQDYSCLVLSVDYEKPLPNLLMEAQYERNRQYANMGQRWTTELKLKSTHSAQSSIFPSAASSLSSASTSGGIKPMEITIDSESEGGSVPRRTSKVHHEASPEIFDRVERSKSRTTSRASRNQAVNASPVRVKEERASPVILPSPAQAALVTPAAEALPSTSSGPLTRRRGRPPKSLLKTPSSSQQSVSPPNPLARKQVTRIPRRPKSPQKGLADLPVARTRQHNPNEDHVWVKKTAKNGKTGEVCYRIPKSFRRTNGDSVDSELLFEAMLNRSTWRLAMKYAALKIFTLDEIRSSTSKGNHWRSKGAVPFDNEKLDGLRGMTAKYVQVKGNHPALDYAKLQNQISQIKVQIVVQSKAKKPSA